MERNPDLTWGEWVKPVWPACRSLQGSVPTPYIFDDRSDYEEVADQIYEWYKTPKNKRDMMALKGREYMMSDDTHLSAKGMCDRFIEDMDTAFEKWTPRNNFDLVEA